MDLVEEIKAAHMAYLQDEWDKWLLEGWRRANVRMKTALRCFMAKYNIDLDTLLSLKRTPTAAWQTTTLVTRFIAAHLPVLNEMLWNGNIDQERLLIFMKTLNTQDELADTRKVQRESTERRKARKEANAENAAHYLVKMQRDYTAHSNWKTCK